MLDIINHIKLPAIGFITTVYGVAISMEMVTDLARCIAAVLAVFTGIITLVIALRKLLKK